MTTLIFCNVLLLLSLRETRKRRISLLKPCAFYHPPSDESKDSEDTSLPHQAEVVLRTCAIPQKESHDKSQHRRVTLVLIAMICSFLIGEFPTHIASRSSAVSLLFPSQPHQVDEVPFRVFKLLSTVLMSCHYSCNFFLYYAFNKRFIKELKRLWQLKWRPKLNSQKTPKNISFSSDIIHEENPNITKVNDEMKRKRKRERKHNFLRRTHISVKLNYTQDIHEDKISKEDINMETVSPSISSC
ncbi:UNVERIFIED_CONTAM: hypothetical protein RMT77_004775 [Armadillidium vulgare]